MKRVTVFGTVEGAGSMKESRFHAQTESKPIMAGPELARKPAGRRDADIYRRYILLLRSLN